MLTTSNNATTASEIQEGIFILQTQGEVVRLTCTGQTQQQTTLARGTYQVNITEGCVLAGGRWELHGMVRKYLSAEALLQGVEIPPLDLPDMVRQNINNSYQVHLDLENHDHYVPNYVKMYDDNDGYPEILVAHHLSWAAIGLITILCILCIIGGIWLYKRRQKIKFFFADALLTKLGAKRVTAAMKYDTQHPEGVKLVKTVESATEEIESV